KFEISEIGSLIPGLEIRDGRLLLQKGKDISTLPDTIDQINTRNTELCGGPGRLDRFREEQAKAGSRLKVSSFPETNSILAVAAVL
ncbi:MAG TPA: hypothetical protein VGM32_09505, partial [Rhodopila sp.]